MGFQEDWDAWGKQLAGEPAPVVKPQPAEEPQEEPALWEKALHLFSIPQQKISQGVGLAMKPLTGSDAPFDVQMGELAAPATREEGGAAGQLMDLAAPYANFIPGLGPYTGLRTGLKQLGAVSPKAQEWASAATKPVAQLAAQMQTDPLSYNVLHLLSAVKGGGALQKALAVGFTGAMGKGTYEAAKEAYRVFEEQGVTPETVAAASKTLASAGLLGLGLAGVGKSMRPQEMEAPPSSPKVAQATKSAVMEKLPEIKIGELTPESLREPAPAADPRATHAVQRLFETSLKASQEVLANPQELPWGGEGAQVPLTQVRVLAEGEVPQGVQGTAYVIPGDPTLYITPRGVGSVLQAPDAAGVMARINELVAHEVSHTLSAKRPQASFDPFSGEQVGEGAQARGGHEAGGFYDDRLEDLELQWKEHTLRERLGAHPLPKLMAQRAQEAGMLTGGLQGESAITPTSGTYSAEALQLAEGLGLRGKVGAVEPRPGTYSIEGDTLVPGGEAEAGALPELPPLEAGRGLMDKVRSFFGKPEEEAKVAEPAPSTGGFDSPAWRALREKDTARQKALQPPPAATLPKETRFDGLKRTFGEGDRRLMKALRNVEQKQPTEQELRQKRFEEATKGGREALLAYVRHFSHAVPERGYRATGVNFPKVLDYLHYQLVETGNFANRRDALLEHGLRPEILRPLWQNIRSMVQRGALKGAEAERAQAQLAALVSKSKRLFGVNPSMVESALGTAGTKKVNRAAGNQRIARGQAELFRLRDAAEAKTTPQLQGMLKKIQEAGASIQKGHFEQAQASLMETFKEVAELQKSGKWVNADAGMERAVADAYASARQRLLEAKKGGEKRAEKAEQLKVEPAQEGAPSRLAALLAKKREGASQAKEAGRGRIPEALLRKLTPQQVKDANADPEYLETLIRERGLKIKPGLTPGAGWQGEVPLKEKISHWYKQEKASTGMRPTQLSTTPEQEALRAEIELKKAANKAKAAEHLSATIAERMKKQSLQDPGPVSKKVKELKEVARRAQAMTGVTGEMDLSKIPESPAVTEVKKKAEARERSSLKEIPDSSRLLPVDVNTKGEVTSAGQKAIDTTIPQRVRAKGRPAKMGPFRKLAARVMGEHPLRGAAGDTEDVFGLSQELLERLHSGDFQKADIRLSEQTIRDFGKGYNGRVVDKLVRTWHSIARGVKDPAKQREAFVDALVELQGGALEGRVGEGVLPERETKFSAGKAKVLNKRSVLQRALAEGPRGKRPLTKEFAEQLSSWRRGEARVPEVRSAEGKPLPTTEQTKMGEKPSPFVERRTPYPSRREKYAHTVTIKAKDGRELAGVIGGVKDVASAISRKLGQEVSPAELQKLVEERKLSRLPAYNKLTVAEPEAIHALAEERIPAAMKELEELRTRSEKGFKVGEERARELRTFVERLQKLDVLSEEGWEVSGHSHKLTPAPRGFEYPSFDQGGSMGATGEPYHLNPATDRGAAVRRTGAKGLKPFDESNLWEDLADQTAKTGEVTVRERGQKPEEGGEEEAPNPGMSIRSSRVRPQMRTAKVEVGGKDAALRLGEGNEHLKRLLKEPRMVALSKAIRRMDEALDLTPRLGRSALEVKADPSGKRLTGAARAKNVLASEKQRSAFARKYAEDATEGVHTWLEKHYDSKRVHPEEFSPDGKYQYDNLLDAFREGYPDPNKEWWLPEKDLGKLEKEAYEDGLKEWDAQTAEGRELSAEAKAAERAEGMQESPDLSARGEKFLERYGKPGKYSFSYEVEGPNGEPTTRTIKGDSTTEVGVKPMVDAAVEAGLLEEGDHGVVSQKLRDAIAASRRGGLKPPSKTLKLRKPPTEEGFEGIDFAASPEELEGLGPLEAGRGRYSAQDLADLSKEIKPFGKKETETEARTRKWVLGALDTLNAGRPLKTSLDFSNVLRQSAMLSFDQLARDVVRKSPKDVSFRKNLIQMVKAAADEKVYGALKEEMRAHPLWDKAVNSRLNLVFEGQHTEGFVGRDSLRTLLEKVPVAGKSVNALVDASERAFNYYQNKVMLDAFEYGLGDIAQRKGGKITERDLEDLVTHINNAAGRGKVTGARGVDKVINQLLYSGQMTASRARMLGNIATGFQGYSSPEARAYARAQTARAVIGGAASAGAVVAVAKLLGQPVRVEKDPRSTDFLKVRIGNTTVDLMGGFQQYLVRGAQVATKQKKSVTTGKMAPVSATETVATFMRGKLAPGPAAVWDALEKRKVSGEAVDFNKDPQGAALTTISTLFANLTVDDALSVWKSNPETMWLMPLGLLGAGLQAGSGAKDDWLDSSTRKMDQKVSDELYKYNVSGPRLGSKVTLPGRDVYGRRNYYAMSPGEVTKFEKQYMPVVTKMLFEFVNSPEYAAIPKSRKPAALEKMIHKLNTFYSVNKKLRGYYAQQFSAGKVKPSGVQPREALEMEEMPDREKTERGAR